jgi:hypothetical protein
MDDFGTDNHEAIWETLITDEGRRTRVIEWFDAMINVQIGDEIQKMNKRAQVLKIQEAYCTLKEIAMRKFFDKEQFLQRQIDKDTVTQHFRRIFARTDENFREAEMAYFSILYHESQTSMQKTWHRTC